MYTLAQLAHFDRCLFPDDFASSLVDAGVGEDEAKGVALYIKTKRKNNHSVGIVSLYQQFIEDNDLTDAFNTVVYKFFNN